MSKLRFVASAVVAFALLSMTVTLGWVAQQTGSAHNEGHALEHLSEDYLAMRGIRATAWKGSTAGLVPENEIERVAARWGPIAEVKLVEVSPVGVASHPPPLGYLPLDNPHLAQLQGPTFAVVFAERGMLSNAIREREDPDTTDAGLPVLGYINVAFYNARTGEFIWLIQHEIVQETLDRWAEWGR